MRQGGGLREGLLLALRRQCGGFQSGVAAARTVVPVDEWLLAAGGGRLRRKTRVLVVGDGDLSFARAVLRRHCRHRPPRQEEQEGEEEEEEGGGQSGLHLVATTLEERGPLQQRYAGAEACIEELWGHGEAVRVLHGVDATALRETLVPQLLDAQGARVESFDVVVWNFPHAANRRRIQDHRSLLRRFFISLAETRIGDDNESELVAKDGVVLVSLGKGQGGTQWEEKALDRLSLYKNSFRVEEQARYGGFLLVDMGPFPIAAAHTLGYGSVGYRLADRAFGTDDALTHLFRRQGTSRPSAAQDRCFPTGGAPLLSRRQALFPARFSYDFSHWTTPRTSATAVSAVVRELLGPLFHAPNVEVVDTFEDPNDPTRVANTFRVETGTVYVAMTIESFYNLMLKVRLLLHERGITVSRCREQEWLHLNSQLVS